MANLSNINGKFVVEQTTGYVGIGTTNPNFLIEAAGTNAELALNAASIYRVRSTSNDEFIITKNGVGDRLTIASGGDATFTGQVHIDSKPNSGLAYDVLIDVGSAGDGTIGYQTVDQLAANIGASTSSNWVKSGNNIYNTNSGNVGIGTSSPSEKLYVASSAGYIATFQSTTATDFRPIRFLNSAGANVGFLGNNGSNNEFFLIAQDRPLIFGTGNGGAERMRITASGNVSIDRTTSNVGGAPSGTDGRFNVYTNVGSSAWAQQMRHDSTTGNGLFIRAGASSSYYTAYFAGYDESNVHFVVKGDGNVGIGTTSFASTANLQLKLGNMGSGIVGEIFDAVDNADNSRIIICGGGTGTPQFSMRHYSAGYGIDMWLNTSSPWDTYIDNRNAASGFIFRNNCNSDGGEDELMRITGSGSVGIGTALPGATLDVNGATYVRNVIYGYAGGGNQYGGLSWGGTDEGFLFLKDSNVTKVNINSNGDSYLNGGNVGIGETSPSAPLHITKNSGASNTVELLRLDCGETSHASGKGGKIVFRDINVYNDTATIEAVRVGASSASELKLTTRGITRSIISRDGYTKMTNSGSTFSISGPYHEMNQSSSSNWSYILHNQSNSPYGMYIKYSGASPNNTQEIIYFADTIQQRFYVTSAGAVYGNGTYGTISDQKLKENIVDATPKLDDINKLKVRNFNFKDKPEEKHIGFIAQEFEEVFPSMIETTQDKDDDNNPIENSYTKTIKSSVLIPMLVKSIQELKQEIETLKTQINN